MDEKPTKAYLITVGKSVRQALDLLTRKREFALLAADQRLSPAQERALERAGCVWVEIRDAAKRAAGSQAERSYLIVSLESHTPSRDALPATGTFPDSELGACLRELECDGRAETSFPPIKALYELCEGATLVVDIASGSEEEANRFWLRGMLRLGMDPGKWYASDDFSSIKVNLKRVSTKPEFEAAEENEPCDESVPVDIAEFEVYSRLRDKLEHTAEDGGYGYPNDVFVEYSVSSEEGSARYCATEFYSNHNWNADPANLLVVRFSAEIVPGMCSQKDVQFAHPTKATSRNVNGERFMVNSLAMANDIETRFHTVSDDDERPDEAVSAARIMDNLIDFNSWVDMHRKEIELL